MTKRSATQFRIAEALVTAKRPLTRQEIFKALPDVKPGSITQALYGAGPSNFSSEVFRSFRVRERGREVVLWDLAQQPAEEQAEAGA